MWAFKSFQGHLSGTKRSRNRALCVIKTAVPGQDVTEGQAAMWTRSFTFYTTRFTHFEEKLTTKCQQECESYFTIENPTPRHKITGKQIPVVVLLVECVTLNNIWNKLLGFAWFLETGNTWLTKNGLLVMLSPGDDKPLNFYPFAYLFLKWWFRNSLGSLWK